MLGWTRMDGAHQAAHMNLHDQSQVPWGAQVSASTVTLPDPRALNH